MFKCLLSLIYLKNVSHTTVRTRLQPSQLQVYFSYIFFSSDTPPIKMDFLSLIRVFASPPSVTPRSATDFLVNKILYNNMTWHPQAIVPKPTIQHSPSKEGINGGSQCPPAEPSPCRVFRSTTYIIRLLYDDAGRYYSSLPLLPTRPSHLQLSNMPLLCNLFSCNPLFLL